MVTSPDKALDDGPSLIKLTVLQTAPFTAAISAARCLVGTVTCLPGFMVAWQSGVGAQTPTMTRTSPPSTTPSFQVLQFRLCSARGRKEAETDEKSREVKQQLRRHGTGSAQVT